MNFKKGIKNISYSILGQFISLALGIFIPRLVIVSYGSDINGLLASIGQVMTYLALLEAGLGSAAVQALYYPISRGDKEGISAVVSATNLSYKKIGYAYLSLVIGLSFLYPLIIRNDVQYWLVWILFIINGMPGVINFFFQGKLRILINAEGDGYVLTNLSTVISVVTSLLKIVLLLANVNIIIVQLMYCGTNLIQLLFVYWYVKRHYPWLNMKQEPNYEALAGRKPAFLHQICGLVTNSTDVMLLTIFCSLEAVSIYSVYNMIFNLVYNVVSGVNSNIQFMLGQAFYKGKTHYCSIIDAYETLYVTAASALLFVTYRMIVPFLKLYTSGADVNYIDNAFPVVFFLVKILHCFKMISITTGSVSGHFEGTKWHAVGEAVINLVISIIVVTKIGMVGVLFGTVISFVFRFVVATIYSNRVILNRSCSHTIKTMLINTALIIAASFITANISLIRESYLQLIWEAIPLTLLSVLTFATVNLILNPRDYRMIKEYFHNALRR